MTRTTITLASALTLFAACTTTDPGPCKPGDATFSTLTGTVKVQGGLDQSFDMTAPTGAAPCTVTSRSSGDRDADVAINTTLDLSCESNGERLTLTFQIDDVRWIDAGDHVLESAANGLRISYRPNESAAECYTYLPASAYQMNVTEATGDFAPYPELVTSDFHRRFDVALDLALRGRSAASAASA